MAEIEMTLDEDGGVPILHQVHVEADNPFKAHQRWDDDAASVASDDDDDHPIPIADAMGHLAHYPREEEHQKHHHKVRLSSIPRVLGKSTHCMD
jgi:hypothetical protein